MRIDLTTPIEINHLAIEIATKLTPKEFALFMIDLLDAIEDVRGANDIWLGEVHRRLFDDIKKRREQRVIGSPEGI